MTKWHIDKGKKVTGGRIHQYRKKKRFQRGSIPLLPEVGEEKKLIRRTRGGNEKVKIVKAQFVNVSDKGKTKRVKILDVLENPASPNYVRRNIITKGTVIKTELGEVRITSRPSQKGIVSGTLLE
ncbi:MAG: 30S ribosomal protein S8e [Candidatus Aenigmarchaeota archaeon]|nr:30S ribosomal protein S8e [Candidatus Aenigmarchaeota archaeon]